MYSPKLWHLAMTALVIFTLVGLSVKQLFSDDAQWEQVSAKGLQQKIQVGLEQIYWQWQNEGRPSEIVYHPENAQKAVNIAMSADGKPSFELNIDNCEKFLNWFVDDISLDQFISVSIDEHSDAPLSEKRTQAKIDACTYSMANQRFVYHVNEAELHYLRE